MIERPLPAAVDLERNVLGAILEEPARLESNPLAPDDFSIYPHGRICRAIVACANDGYLPDLGTVARRLKDAGELESVGGLGYLVDLDSAMPKGLNLDGWLRQIKDKAARRKVIFTADALRDSAFLEDVPTVELLANAAEQIARLSQNGMGNVQRIPHISALESVFTSQEPLKYVREPELPEKSLVSLVGDSESGKTTTACAWARDANIAGHAVLILDRDRNPRERIRERLVRLGVSADVQNFHIWDGEQTEQAPQPNDRRIVAWVREMSATGKSPIVIADSLISFMAEDEDENCANDMRALFDRCRVLTGVGATVIIIHHLNKNGVIRGSSDFKAASDQSFTVTNFDFSGGRLLHTITLKVEKSRYGLRSNLVYRYEGGKMQRDRDKLAADANDMAKLVAILRQNPGASQNDLEKLCTGMSHEKVRLLLQSGLQFDQFRAEPGPRRSRLFHLNFTHENNIAPPTEGVCAG